MFAQIMTESLAVEHHTVTINCVGVEIQWVLNAMKHAARGSFTREARTFLAGVAANLETQMEINREAASK